MTGCTTALALAAAALLRGEVKPATRHDIPYSTEIVTPHVPWATKLPGGPIRGFFVPPVTEGRDMVELMQRLSARADHGDHRPQLGRQLLGHRRLVRRRPRAARRP